MDAVHFIRDKMKYLIGIEDYGKKIISVYGIMLLDSIEEKLLTFESLRSEIMHQKCQVLQILHASLLHCKMTYLASELKNKINSVTKIREQ